MLMGIQRNKRLLRKVVPSRLVAYAVMRRAHPEAGVLEVLRRSRLVRGVTFSGGDPLFQAAAGASASHWRRRRPRCGRPRATSATAWSSWARRSATFRGSSGG